MSRKLRVYELARHYGVESKQIMLLLKKMKVEEIKSHMSVVEDEHVDRIHAVFQQKREIARLNYARAHKLDPEQLKAVAALRPLPRPVPTVEPEPDPETVKKKVTKKKKKVAAKNKVVVITKAGTQTKVARDAAAKRDAEDKTRAEREEATRRERERLDAEREARRDEHRIERTSARPKLVKKANIETEAEAPSQLDEAHLSEAPVVDQSADPFAAFAEPAVAPAPAEITSPAAVASADAPVGPTAETAATALEPVVDSAGEVSADETETDGRRRPVIKNDGFSVGDIIQAAPKPEEVAAAAAVAAERASASKQSVKESIQAAIRRRQEEKEAKEATGARRTRVRTKKKKVDEAEVDRAVKQTMAQLETSGGRRPRRRKGGGAEAVEEENALRITEFITVQEFAEKLGIPAREIITKLFALGVMTTMNQRLDRENIEVLAEEYDRDIEFLSEYGEEVLEAEEIKDEDLETRPPVVTVMGHVDHGKTSLLDRIRSTNVIAGEAGGITQHIGAYRVETAGGPITFLDTPGHAAFSAMRARGASVTDIVILVVAANDGVMPQTIEAINHAKAAGVPIVVAVNKVDLPDAKSDRVKQELAQHGVMVEEYGGEVLCAEISAKKGLNIERLLELIHLQAEVLELSASPKGRARGTVVEARKEPGRGVVFSVLIERGTLKVGDIFLVGLRDGRVRLLINERGEKLEEVLPGQPAEVLGANDVPEAGDRFYVMESEREAREIAGKRQRELRMQQLAAPRKKLDLANLAELISAEELKELPIIIKGDVAGSVEALADQFMELGTSEVQVRIVHRAVGAISESDVLLAANTGAMIIGFHMRPGAAITELSKQHHVTIEVFDIIYEAVDTLKKAMTGLLGSVQREVSTGRAQVRQVFFIPKVGQIAGSMVLDGKIIRNSRARLVRDEMVVFEGKISSLKRFKEDTKEVAQGFECGIGLDRFDKIQDGDIIEAYEIEEVAREL